MTTQRVLISGAGIAGPALAFCLQRHGFQTTVVERAPILRTGGYAVDFRGPVHFGVLQRMGVLEDVRQFHIAMRGTHLIDAAGRTQVHVPAEVFSGDLEVQRGDLSNLFHALSKDGTEYIFGDSIAAMQETPQCVEVAFAQGPPRSFDLVVGADGMHSRVRALAFGEDAAFVHDSGYAIASYTMPNILGIDRVSLIYTEPGRGVMVSNARYPDELNVTFGFRAAGELPHGSDALKRMVAGMFAGVGWQTPRLLPGLWETPDLYADTISQVKIDTLYRSRIVLLGDAGYGATVGGLGTGLAVVCAYVLAGELAAAAGDHRIAFPRYAALIRDYARGCQALGKGVGPFLAPHSRAAIWRRNLLYRLLFASPASRLFAGMPRKAASAFTLPEYGRTGDGSRESGDGGRGA